MKRSVISAKNASDLAGTEAQTTDAGSVRKDDDFLIPGGDNKDERDKQNELPSRATRSVNMKRLLYDAVVSQRFR